MKLLRILRNLCTLSVLPLLLLLPGNAFASPGLNGYLTLDGGWTNNHTDLILNGTLPSYCTDIGVVFSNPVTSSIDLSFISGLDPGFSISNGTWSLNLGSNNVSLVNGNYDVYLSSMCGSGSYLSPLYEDLFPDAINIEPVGCDNTCLPLHRFYDFQNGSHFYTDSDPEASQVNQANTTYTYEGIDSFVEGQQVAGTLPVYRFYDLQNGSHFYTTDQTEATLINDTEFTTYHYEGIAFYAYSNPVADSVPVYRFYDFQNGTHFYTSNQTEATQVNNTEYTTYRYEGIAYYDIANAN